MPADARSSPGHPTSSQLQWALQRAAGRPVSAGPITIARPLIGARTRSATLSPAARPRLRPPRPPARSAAPGGGNDAAGVCIRRTEKPLRRAMGRARIGDATSLLATSWGRWRTGPRPSCRCGPSPLPLCLASLTPLPSVVASFNRFPNSTRSSGPQPGSPTARMLAQVGDAIAQGRLGRPGQLTAVESEITAHD